MRYIIAGKNTAAGVKGNDSADLGVYFELGWEVVGSRLDAIKLLKTGKLINDDTTIVTVEDRMFMYTSIFKNVISWIKFKEISNDLGPNDTVEDWTETKPFSFLNPNGDCEFWENNDSRPSSYSRYSRYEQDYEEITNGFTKNDHLLDHLSSDETFYVACLRFRDHCDFRSSPTEWWTVLLNRIASETNRRVFLIGHGSENFEKNDMMKHVPRLQDYVTLIQDPRCRAVIAQSTGTCGLAFSASKAPVHWIDHANVSFIDENNAVMGGTCALFLKSPVYRYGSFDINEIGIDKILSRIS
jgi:hypothetical protein